MFLPRSMDVRRNGKVGIKTLLITWQYDGIRSVEDSGDSGEVATNEDASPTAKENPWRRLWFVTNPYNRVWIRRKQECLDVMVSPRDVHGFIQALETMNAQGEDSPTSDTPDSTLV